MKVLDFGLAKALTASGPRAAAMSHSPTLTAPAMTVAGLILGTAAYMSPEQARGTPVDKRADIWAFGVRAVRDAHRPARIPRRGRHRDARLGLGKEPDWGALPARLRLRCDDCSSAV